jgi:hypothetical protein
MENNSQSFLADYDDGLTDIHLLLHKNLGI